MGSAAHALSASAAVWRLPPLQPTACEALGHGQKVGVQAPRSVPNRCTSSACLALRHPTVELVALCASFPPLQTLDHLIRKAGYAGSPVAVRASAALKVCSRLTFGVALAHHSHAAAAGLAAGNMLR